LLSVVGDLVTADKGKTEIPGVIAFSPPWSLKPLFLRGWVQGRELLVVG